MVLHYTFMSTESFEIITCRPVIASLQRDFGERRYHENRRGYRRQDSHEEEPEWFTGGPSSQNEVIELHGFEGPKSVKEETEAELRKEKSEAVKPKKGASTAEKQNKEEPVQEQDKGSCHCLLAKS